MSNLILFEEKQVRRIWDEQEQKWYFVIADVISVLTESVDPSAYWRKLKERLKKEGNETVTNCHSLKMTAADGKKRSTDVADAEQLLRLIQSIPSPKAEPFKRWLAKVGYERLEEIENPELAAKRMCEIYKQKGYSDDWIEKRARGIAVRDELTNEWKKRGVKEQKEYSILTAEISKATFGMTPSEYKQFNGVPFEDVGGSKTLRYYQEIAVNNALAAITEEKSRILLTLATGTGKTFIAFQIAWKLFQTRWTLQRDGLRRPRILFLADRNILANEAFNPGFPA